MGIVVSFKSVIPFDSFPVLNREEFNNLIDSKVGFRVGVIDGFGTVEEFHEWRNPADLLNWMAKHLDFEKYEGVTRFKVTGDDLDNLYQAIDDERFFSFLNVHRDDVGCWSRDYRRAILKARNRLKKGAVIYLEVA